MCDDCEAKIKEALRKLSISVSVSKAYGEYGESYGEYGEYGEYGDSHGVKVEVELMYDYETISKYSDYTILN